MLTSLLFGGEDVRAAAPHASESAVDSAPRMQTNDPPPQRSTFYDGSNGAEVIFAQPSAYDQNVNMTVETWVYRMRGSIANSCETVLSRNSAASYWLGFCGERIRFYRSGGIYADSALNVRGGSELGLHF
ncbi:hypothetical protein KFU94_30725 [Chloroflexi bacterium TSY]|nr:hypothetical protein [Chloroflexi bacterium TSY]